ncbi:MAG: hypothetical protein KDJ41_19230 [Hyphomicrobiaceae bacterium]|nr:hypothetical protein [Hyphomicrobiaceae bacterium]
MKLLRTIRFDRSDERVYEVAAAESEWAVSGAFAFAGVEREALVGKVRQAFANGFLGLPSFGRSTFAVVAEAGDGVCDELAWRLASHFVNAYGAPTLEAAMPAAEEETAFVAELCRDVAINTVFTVRRTLDSSGRIREEFRKIRPPTGEPQHARIWKVVDDEA